MRPSGQLDRQGRDDGGGRSALDRLAQAVLERGASVSRRGRSTAAARGRFPTTGLRAAFVDPQLQTVVWICLVIALIVSSLGILSARVNVFRIGWAFWLIGIAGFLAGGVRLGIELRGILRLPPR